MAGRVTAAAAACVAAGLALPAVAQEAQFAAQQAGTKRWAVTASAVTTFESDVRGQVLTTDGNVQGEDVIFTPGVTATVTIPSGRQRWFASAGASYSFYQNNDQLNRERVTLDAGVESRIARCSVTPRVGFSRGQTDLIDLAFEEVENIDTRTKLALDVDCSRPSGLSPFLSVSRSEVENSGVLRRDADAVTDSASGGLSYSRGSLGTLSAFVSYSDTTFTERVIVLPGAQVEDGFEVWAGGLRLRRELSTRLSGTLSGSYSTVEPKAPNSEGFDGGTYGVNLTYRPTQLTTLALSATKDVQPSNRLGSTYVVADSATLTGTYLLGGRITLRAGAGRDRREYEGLSVPPPGSPVVLWPREEEITRLFAGARWQFTGRVAFTADVGYDRRESDLAAFDRDSTRVSLGAVATF